MTPLLLALLLAAPTPPDIDAAIRIYYRQREHEAVQAEGVGSRGEGVGQGVGLRVSGVGSDPADPRPPTPDTLPGASPVLFALLRPGTTAPLTEAVAGEPLVLLGENLPLNGRLYIAQREANVIQRTATFYELTAPADLSPTDPRPLTGVVDLFAGNQHQARLAGSFTLIRKAPEPVVTIRGKVTGTGAALLKVGGMLQVSSPTFTGTVSLTEVVIEGTPTPPPPTPSISLLTPIIQEVRGGVPERPRAPLEGDTIIVRGLGFGSVRGAVEWGVVPVVPFLWTDTEIRFVMPGQAGGVHPRGQSVSIRPAGGGWMTTGAFIR